MSKNEKRHDSDLIDFRAIIRDYISHWWLFALCIVGCTALGFIFAKVRLDKYEVRANIIISQDDTRNGNPMAGLGSLGNLFSSSSVVDDEVFIVSSHSLMRDVTKKLNLNKTHIVKNNLLTKVFRYQDFPIEVYTDPAIADTLRSSIAFNVKVSDKGNVTVTPIIKGEKEPKVKASDFPVTVKTIYGDFILNKTKYFPEGESVKSYISFSGYDDAAENVSEDLSIYVADKKANAIAMSMVSTDVDYAKDVINTVISLYNQRGIDDKNAKSQKTATFIDSRLELLSRDLNAAEETIETYKQRQGITDVGAETGYQMKKRGEMEALLVEAETQLQIVKMVRDFISDPANAYSLVPMTTVTADAAEAIKAYNDLVLKRIELAQNARSGNLGLQALDSQIDAMRKNIDISLNKAYESAEVALSEVKSQIASTESKLGQIPTLEREYRDIQRQRSIKEQLYIFLLQRREETAMMLANSIPKGVVVDEAYSINEPVGLSKKAILLIAFVMGLFLAPVILYLRSLFRNKFSTREELERLTSVPIVGEVCTSRAGKNLVVTSNNSSSVCELFRLIRTNLSFILNRSDDKVILVTSTISGEGKSFISSNLASTLALDRKKVLLVGLDIRNPKLAEYLDLPPHRGITEYLSSDQVSVDDIIMKNPLKNGIDIIVGGPIPPNPAELLNEEKVDALFETLRGMYDYIIVDSAPVGMVSDTFSLVRISDATVYVCRADYSTTKEVDFINTLYDDSRLKKMTLVINGTKARKGYGYGYGRKAEA